VEYRGILYEIRIRPVPNEWAWIIHLPNSIAVEGGVKGTRDRATVSIHATIDKWLKQQNLRGEPELG
jgi:hypothetical protein